MTRILLLLLFCLSAQAQSARWSAQRAFVELLGPLFPQAVTPIPNTTFPSVRGDMNVNFSALDNISRPIFDYGTPGALKGDGTTDDTTAFQAAITACPSGVQLELGGPEHVFKLTGTINLKSNCRLHATGAIIKQVTANTAWADFGGLTNIVLDGLTWDGNGNGGGLIASSAADHITIKNSKCQNVAGTFPANNCFYYSTSLADSDIVNNNFTSTAGFGAYGFITRRVRFDGTHCSAIVGDCIFLTNDGTTPHQSYGVLITDTVATGLTRMGIELSGAYADAPVISRAVIGQWTSPGVNSFCISMATAGGGNGATIADITCNGDSVTPICIEDLQSHATLSRIYCTGFGIQVSINGATDVLVADSDLFGANISGITFANTSSSARAIIRGVRIREPQNSGIDASSKAEGMLIQGVTIDRTPGFWAGDSSTTFNSIAIGALSQPITVTNSNLILENATVPGSFTWYAIRVNGQTAHSFYSMNSVTNLTTGLFGTAFRLNSATTELDLTHLRDNRLSGLAAASNAPGGSTVIASCNVALNSTPTNIIVTACP